MKSEGTVWESPVEFMSIFKTRFEKKPKDQGHRVDEETLNTRWLLLMGTLSLPRSKGCGGVWQEPGVSDWSWREELGCAGRLSSGVPGSREPVFASSVVLEGSF